MLTSFDFFMKRNKIKTVPSSPEACAPTPAQNNEVHSLQWTLSWGFFPLFFYQLSSTYKEIQFSHSWLLSPLDHTRPDRTVVIFIIPYCAVMFALEKLQQWSGGCFFEQLQILKSTLTIILAKHRWSPKARTLHRFKLLCTLKYLHTRGKHTEGCRNILWHNFEWENEKQETLETTCNFE